MCPERWELVVTLNKEKYPVITTWDEENGFTVEIDNGRTIELSTDWSVGDPMMLASMNGKDVTVQVLIACKDSFILSVLSSC